MMKVFLADLPDLIEIQKNSFCWFLEKGLSEELKQLSIFHDFLEMFELRFFENEFYFFAAPVIKDEPHRNTKVSYSIRIFVPLEVEYKKMKSLKRKKRKNIELHTMCLCEFPLMTDRGTFVVNGCERTIIGQLVRCPGIYYDATTLDGKIVKTNAILVSIRGSWLYFEADSKDLVWLKTDLIEKVPITLLLEDVANESKKFLSHLENTDHFNHLVINADQLYTSKVKKTKTKGKVYKKDFVSDWENLKNEIFNPEYFSLGKLGREKINKKLSISLPTKIQHLTLHDVVEIIDYLISLKNFLGNKDDIDSLENRRIRFVGELLQLQFSQALLNFRAFLQEKNEMENSIGLNLFLNPFPIQFAINEFFATNPLSQFLDQINPLAELIHKRRVTVLGPGGIPLEKANLAIRDIHPTYYGRLCPIDTTEGEKAGLVASLATYVQNDEDGFLQTPFFSVSKAKIRGLTYLNVGQEDGKTMAMGESLINKKGFLVTKKIGVKENDEFIVVSPSEIDYLSVSPFHLFSPGISLIPFFEHDDANRTLMGAHMQRQAVPLLKPQKPVVGTGIELNLAFETGSLILSYSEGTVRFVSSTSIWIQEKNGNIILYPLEKLQSSNNYTLVNHRPIVWIGEEVVPGNLLADGSCTDEGELALGKNVTVAYMPWSGFNYEDAIVISERLVYENIFTSIHIEKLEVEIKDHEIEPDYVTKNIPELTTNESFLLRNLDENGIVFIGSYVQSGDALVGKISPKEVLHKGLARLMKDVFGVSKQTVFDSSLRVPLGMIGKVLDVCIVNQETNLDFSPKVLAIIQIFLASIKRIQVGDKMAGRHGNKGVISTVVSLADFPFFSDGTLVDILLNPLGVPSRMNVGQLFESLLGWAGQKLEKRFKIFPFDEIYGLEASRTLVYEELANIKDNLSSHQTFLNKISPGKVILHDGRTGLPFDNPITVGKPYILKLIHLVDEKIHARSIGPYSMITQQPLQGKSREGGQRFGEMEVWALQAYGTAHTLQELLTLKSDDITGRLKAYMSLTVFCNIPSPGVPESFRILLRELRSLAVDINALRFMPFSSGKLEPKIKQVKM